MDSIDSIDFMDSIDSIESSLRPGRGRGSMSPFSILLITCRILLSAAPARASICFRVSLSALRIYLTILRSASRCRRSCSRTHFSSSSVLGLPECGKLPLLCPIVTPRPQCEPSRPTYALPLYGTSGSFLVFGGIGGLRGLLPSPSVASYREVVASPFSKLALAFIRTLLPASFTRRGRFTPRILETRATSSISSTLSCQLISLCPPDTLPDFLSKPERSTGPVVLPRGPPPVATRGDAARLCGEGRCPSS